MLHLLLRALRLLGVSDNRVGLGSLEIELGNSLKAVIDSLKLSHVCSHESKSIRRDRTIVFYMVPRTLMIQ